MRGLMPSSRTQKPLLALKPYYPYGCKRPTFHDEFLPTFNLPHVTLVDTAPLGVSRNKPLGCGFMTAWNTRLTC